MSKNIGIVTFFESNNFGTCLQAFAIQSIINKIGYNSVIINYKREGVLKNKSKVSNAIKIIKHNPFKNFTNYKRYKKFAIDQIYKFSNFRKYNLNIGIDKYSCIEEISSNESKYAAFICGSDMVWSKDRVDDLRIYFLQFTSFDKRIAYAPSFGSDKLNAMDLEIYKELINDMKYISCRERSGIDIINSLTNREAKFVLDPTLLFNQDEWNNMLSIREVNDKSYILCYIFGGITKDIKNIINKVAEIQCYDIRIIPMTLNDYTLDMANTKEGYGPIEFIELFKNAKFIITNSYHGLIFSLIYKKPFFAIKRNNFWTKYEDRLKSLLSELNLSERYIKQDSIITSKMLNIDYSHALEIIKKNKIDSLNYLKKSLNNAINK